jgi:hypothetical protein
MFCRGCQSRQLGELLFAHLYHRRNNQIAATSTRTTEMVAGNILSRCFEEDDESMEGRTELLAEGTTEDADRVA